MGINIDQAHNRHPYLDAHMRYFTSHKKDSNSEQLVIPKMMDPLKLLKRFEGGPHQLFYGGDNVVKYYE